MQRVLCTLAALLIVAGAVGAVAARGQESQSAFPLVIDPRDLEPAPSSWVAARWERSGTVDGVQEIELLVIRYPQPAVNWYSPNWHAVLELITADGDWRRTSMPEYDDYSIAFSRERDGVTEVRWIVEYGAVIWVLTAAGVDADPAMVLADLGLEAFSSYRLEVLNEIRSTDLFGFRVRAIPTVNSLPIGFAEVGRVEHSNEASKPGTPQASPTG